MFNLLLIGRNVGRSDLFVSSFDFQAVETLRASITTQSITGFLPPSFLLEIFREARFHCRLTEGRVCWKVQSFASFQFGVTKTRLCLGLESPTPDSMEGRITS